MSIELSQVAAPTQAQTLAPAWLIEANQVLALSSAELQTLIQKELEENPALELEERPICPTCGRVLRSAACSSCLSLASSEPAAQNTARLDEGDAWLSASARSGYEHDEFDPTMLLPTQVSLADQLRLILQAQLPDDDALIIDFLVGSLDEEGYLRTTVLEVAQVCEVSTERVERVLALLQAQEPMGVGARTVRECLLIQMRFLEAQGVHQPAAAHIIDRYLPQLAAHKYRLIAQSLGVSIKQVEQAHDFMKRMLHPFPTHGYLGAQVNMESALPSPVQPDVIINHKPDAAGTGYDIEVVEAQRFALQISPAYAEASRPVAQQSASLEERQHIHDYLRRSRLFIANIRRRWETLQQITACVAKFQQAFLEQGTKALLPLTRERVAGELSLHPSTVSRATAAKYVLLPNAQVVPFHTFFTANLSIKELLKEVIHQEDQPLSDQQLTEMLQARGVQVARRTVTKYREALKIPSSSAR